MRITRVDAVPIAIPLAEEFHWAGGAQVGANLVLFAVHTEDGVVGWGESVCEVPLATAEFGRAIARQVIGQRIDDVEAIPPLQPLADKTIFNDVLEALATRGVTWTGGKATIG